VDVTWLPQLSQARSSGAAHSSLRAPPDGYTLLLVDGTASINATLYEKLNYNFIRDIATVAGIVRLPTL
jgi:tripartite-type tricarboxylate transporter receptor subunit TctC